MKGIKLFYTRQILIMAVVIALLAANRQGITFAKASDMSDEVIATTIQLTMVHESPELDSRVETVLMPVAEVRLVGRSADGKWLALGAGWIPTGNIRTNGELAALPVMQMSQSFSGVTIGLTMVYQNPTMSSRVVDVLSPVSIVSLSGRSSDGDWLAVANIRDPGSVKGWVGRGDLQMIGDLAALPVMGMAFEVLPGLSYAGLGNEN